MLIEYEHSRDPVIVYKDQIFVQNQYKDKANFHPSELIFLTLSSPQLKQLTDKDLFVKSEEMTIAYQLYRKLQAEKMKVLPLLRKALLDPQLPDINYFPFGKCSENVLSEGNISPYAGKTEFLNRIGRLKDHKAIPEIRELLFHADDTWDNDDMTQVKNGYHIKDKCIETLGTLGAKGILFEYLQQPKAHLQRYIQSTLTALMQNCLTDADLPRLMKLCEKYESLDQEAFDIHPYYLNKLFYKGYAEGGLRGMEHRGITHDRDQDAPVQWLLCKAIARIGTQKSVEMLEHIYQHAAYREMNRCALTGIRHRAFLQKDAFKHKTTNVHRSVIERIFREYVDFDNRDLFDKPMQYAWTTTADEKAQEERHKREKQERIDKQQRLAKDAEYFKTLNPGDEVHIELPFNYNDKECVGKVIENDGEVLLIESQFDNKKKIGRRKFRIKNGKSKGPAEFVDADGWGKKPYFYSLLVPQPPKDTRRTAPATTKIPLLGQPEPEDLPF